MVASTVSLAGAEIITFLAPPFKCRLAFSRVVNRPVHSNTTSTFNSPQGSLAGSRSASTRILSPLTTMYSPSTSTLPGNLPCAVS